MSDQGQEIYIVVVAGVVLGLLLVGFIVTILFLYQRRRIHQEREMASMKDTLEKEALRSQLEIQEGTFRNISQELHDNIGQMLSVTKMTLSTLPIEKDHESYASIQSARDVLNKAIVDMSNLTKGLHTERIADLGLSTAIQFELDTIRKTRLLDVQFSAEGTEYPFDEQKSIFLFRIFQETLNNILKHAKATLLVVQLTYLDDNFIMIMKDNGTGFNVQEKRSATESGTGVGLKSLYNRARLIGASLDIESTPGTGTSVTIQIKY